MLYLKSVDVSGVLILSSREEVIYGDLLAVIVYSILLLLMVKSSHQEFTDIPQLWHKNDEAHIGLAPIP